MKNLSTKNEITWCPGCPNFIILESVKKVLSKFKQKNLCMVTDIGCHGKIFDYLNISGIYGLHGRALPTALGITLGNPNLNVLVFMGDGGIYSEGIGHFVSAGRFNPNLTLIVHDNQSFSLTTGQPTPTSQQGYKSKALPLGEPDKPLNPIKLALASGISFIARCNARDENHTAKIIKKAIEHRGFSFVEIIQDCLVFNLEINNKDKLMYKIKDNKNKKTAERLAEEWDYNSKKGRIPLGVLYYEKKPTLADKWPQLKKLEKRGKGWINK
jgi:2-oxoglutarate/2-oxoacid ferredoxin oxidoreductase subunit beta